MIVWTPERIAELSSAQIKTLRSNAVRNGKSDVVGLCDAELLRRRPTRQTLSGSVVGFHFVCPRETGVTKNGDGTVWTGTWVVDRAKAEHGEKIAAYVALHVSKAENSYLQGVIEGWRISKRDREYAEDRPVRIQHGIDFLIRLTVKSYEWKGDGAGEKGYAWA
jgi:hypothetical protein